MVKFIIDINADVVTREVVLFSDSFLIINESCFFPEEYRRDFKFCENLSKNLSSGKFFYRTSSKIEKGVILAKLFSSYPNARLLTANVNYFKKVMPGVKTAPFQVDDKKPENIVYYNEKIQEPGKDQGVERREEPVENRPAPKMQIPERRYEDSLQNPQKFIKQPLIELKPSGPLIGKPQLLLPEQGKEPSHEELKAPVGEISLKDRLDPISRYEAKKTDIISSFESKTDLQLLSEIILNYEDIRLLKSFSELFRLALESSLDILDMSDFENTEKLKEIILAFFEKKLFIIKSEKCDVSDLFTKNCWNIEIEFRQN
jgi:hypothetical protein